MPGFAADASATLPWGFRDEATSWSENLLDRVAAGERMFVPAHYLYEVTNALRAAERRGRIELAEVDAFLNQLHKLGLEIEPTPSPNQLMRVLALSRRHTITVYDAAYLELALRLGLELATLDGELIAAARSEGVALC